MSWIDWFFQGTAQAPLVYTPGTPPSFAITPATDSASGSMSAADKAKLDGFPALPAGGTAIPGSGTTPVALFTFAIPTGYDAIVTFDLSAKVTGGSSAGGHVGQRLAQKLAVLFVNPSGTPAAGTGSYPVNTTPQLWAYDEEAGLLTGGVIGGVVTLSYTFAPNSVTVKVAGVANVNADWSAVVTSISPLQE